MISHLIIILLSVLGTAIVYFCAGSLFWAWAPLLFLGFFVVLQILHAASIPFLFLFLPKEKKPEHPTPWVNAYIRYMMRWLMPLCGVRVILKGGEKIPAEPSVIVSNHRSMFDPMVMIKALPKRNVVFVSKIENFNIPIAWRFFASAGFLPIDRDNAMKALREIRRGVKMMQTDGIDVGIYPEGTRSKTGELLPFKSGAFLMAQKSGAPVVVMVTRNTADIAHGFPLRMKRVELEVLEVLDAETVRSMSLDGLTERVRNRIASAL